MRFLYICYIYTSVLLNIAICSDITQLAFGDNIDGLPAAFGDFNSDELTDVFVLRENYHKVEILLGYEEEPLLRPSRPDPLSCSFDHHFITSVVPGDFDGDALMDVLITATTNHEMDEHHREYVFIIWGGATFLNCTNTSIIEMRGQPLAIDYNQDMIIDLFGQDEDGKSAFWVFNSSGEFTKLPMSNNIRPLVNLKVPHANAFLDLNGDYMADLFLTTKDHEHQEAFEIWYGKYRGEFEYKHTIKAPVTNGVVGQSLFIDVELKGKMNLVTPVCFDEYCKKSALLLYSTPGDNWSEGTWLDLQVNFKDENAYLWGFYKNSGKHLQDSRSRYLDVITLHTGDFNMDGYPDILATLSLVQNDSRHPQSFLLENVPCQRGMACGNLTRTYTVTWNALSPFKNGTAMAAFFDFYQDGILDCILVKYDGKESKVAAFKNSLDYDANFIKVMVLTGLTNKNNAMIMGRVGKKRRTYGTNLPGPSISYKTTTQDGNIRHGVAAQLPQSAHYSLNLPYSIFGLGRTPNFVDQVTVGLSNHSRQWTQIIPNSQMVVIPWPPDDPSRWKAQLFVTPSKLILMSVAGLTTVCGLITVIIGVLYWKERQEDKKERLSESHRFHFDAM